MKISKYMHNDNELNYDEFSILCTKNLIEQGQVFTKTYYDGKIMIVELIPDNRIKVVEYYHNEKK